ncbi:hypothetical protein K458DRAFT_492665 [Lentithecium fluviatile CBS 122367]|uniref:Uncharacterized protein n=1 Tax=Lentithecium fluviatile CBS 122367 TaxID=1168545 RepID=A0A6G1ID30_9PLEO|nr:hypothetical protein K458DRAFT_492665 [Lentithecium fluviatile CBS 122367]
MARRSARLQKRSPAPAERSSGSSDGWGTAQSHSSPAQEQLPSVIEQTEPAMKTPRKPAVAQPASAVSTTKSSQLPQPSTGTPARTPKNRTLILPANEEMHPAHHHASTAKPREEARWLGFQTMDPHTAPPKAAGSAAGQATPSKAPTPMTPKVKSGIASMGFPFQGFNFRVKSPVAGLSPTSSSILKGYKDGSVADSRALFKADEFTAPEDMGAKRKTAVPKGKMSRFSDAHMKQFKKMDSIANHPSAFRADPSRFKPVIASAKKSLSKLDLHATESSAKTSNILKRTQSKMDVTELISKMPAVGLKRTQSKMDVTEPTSNIPPPTRLKRTQSKMDMTASSLPLANSTVRLVPPTRDGRPPTQDGNPFAKRVKRNEGDDAATTRPLSREGKPEADKATAEATISARKITSQTALPRLASRFMTPTKAAIARSQSVKALKSESMIPSLAKSPTHNLFSPTNLGNAMKDTVREGIRKTSDSVQRFRSILRTPSRKFSADPVKVAAGTHLSPPPGLDLHKALPLVPQTAPVKKHVNFTTSTLERANEDELGKSPSPMKFRAGSEVPSGAVIYPTLRNTGNVEYPAIAEEVENKLQTSPSRRLTFGGATANTPGEFSFKSDKPINFGPASTGTIRMVRKSDASSLVDGKKRKLNTLEETSDKENSGPVERDEGRSAKKMKPTPAEAPKTPSKLPRLGRTPKRGSAISMSRLAFLATPKRGKA